jgi:hypothetical protein
MSSSDGVFREIETTVAAKAVMRRMGMGPSAAQEMPALAALIARGIGEGGALAAPAAVRATFRIACNAGGVVGFRGTRFTVQSVRVAALLAPCSRATLIGATVGAGLTSAAARLMREKRMTEAMILDAYGSEAVEAVVDAAAALLEREAAEEGFELTRRFSPGYGDWALEAQPGVLAALGAERIGISAGQGCILVPEKSVTAVVGWLPRGKR